MTRLHVGTIFDAYIVMNMGSVCVCVWKGKDDGNRELVLVI